MKFTIRDLFWLTVVVALAVGWIVEHRTIEARFTTQEAALQSAIDDLRRDQQALLNSVRSAERHAKEASSAASQAKRSAARAAALR